MYHRLTIGQIIGSLLLGITVMVPGLSLAGFHGGTSWHVLGWVCVSIVGGFVAGFLLAPKHRIAGAIGGMIGAPCGLLALYFYARNRQTIYSAEAVLITAIASLPGVAIYFVLRLFTDLVFPARPEPDEDVYDDEEDERRREDDDQEERPRKRRRLEDDDEEDRDRPRSRRRYEDDDDRERGGAHRPFDEDDD